MASLLCLPAELQDAILLHCDKDTLLSIRLLHSSWLPSATAAAFSHYQVSMLPWSFERLFSISESRLAGIIRSVTIYSASIGDLFERSPQDLDQDEQLLPPSYADFKSRMQLVVDRCCQCVPPRGIMYFLPKRNWPQAYKTFLSVRDAQRKLYDSNSLDQLAQLLAKLPRLTSLSLQHFPEYEYFSRSTCSESWTAGGTSIALAREVTRIVRGAECNRPDVLRRLSPGIIGPQLRSLRIQQMCSVDWDVEQLRPALDQLDHLDLELLMHHSGSTDSEQTIEQFNAAIISCLKSPKLKSLAYRRAHTTKAPEIEAFLSSHTWPELRSLTLSAELSNQTMEAMLQHHRLKELRMLDCELTDVEAFLEAIPRLTTLSTVEMTELKQYDSAADYPTTITYFRKGIDEAIRSWLCSGRGPMPLWKGEPDDQDGGCWSDPDDLYNANVPLDVIFDEDGEPMV